MNLYDGNGMGTGTMLDRLRSTGTGRDIALDIFKQKYQYLILRIAADYKLNSAEADELLSVVLREVWQHAVSEHYNDPRKPFRAFLRTVIKRRASDLLRKRKSWLVFEADPKATLDSNADDEDWNKKADADADAAFSEQITAPQFDKLYYRSLILSGLNELRGKIEEKTYQIFDLAMIKRRPSKDVADFFDVSVNYVNKVKRDNCERLRQIIQELMEHGDDLPYSSEDEFEQEVTATVGNFKEWA